LIVGAIRLLFVFQATFIHESSRRLELSVLNYLQFFLVGFLLADVYLTEWKSQPEGEWKWDLISLVGWPALFLVLRSPELAHYVFPFLTFLLYCGVFRSIYFREILSNPYLTAVGGMCYSIYLLHYPIISFVGRFTSRITLGDSFAINLLFQIALISVFILGISAVYFLLIEKPCMYRDWPQRLWGWLQGRTSKRHLKVSEERLVASEE
jgi:peptidoglycan/LPS O-acetylase OafA/YrhL